MELTNFRDLGGLIGLNGRAIKEKVLLRGAQPVGLVKGDTEMLKNDYRLTHIIDFRGQHEISKDPVDDIEGAEYLNIDIMASQMSSKNKAPSIEEMVKNLHPGVADVFMRQAYTDFVTSEDAKAGYRLFIDTLLNHKGSLLFHCYAGKDRTGWGAVLILKILGVSDEDIMADYLATIEARRVENERLIVEYRQKGLSQEQLDSLEEMMSVKPSYLEAAFDAVKQGYGSFDNYLRQALNVTTEEIAKLQDSYLK